MPEMSEHRHGLCRRELSEVARLERGIFLLHPSPSSCDPSCASLSEQTSERRCRSGGAYDEDNLERVVHHRMEVVCLGVLNPDLVDHLQCPADADHLLQRGLEEAAQAVRKRQQSSSWK